MSLLTLPGELEPINITTGDTCVCECMRPIDGIRSKLILQRREIERPV